MMRYIAAFLVAMLILGLLSWWYAMYTIHHSFDHLSLPT